MTPQLATLRTDLGDRTLYDSVSQCNRCGYCEQVCPTYVLTGKEAFSGRGRNQLVRSMLEGKLDDPASASEALSTCLLCGACTTICYAHVATADHVLEGRRALRAKRYPGFTDLLLALFAKRPGDFRKLLKASYRLKRLGLSRLAARSGLLRLLGLPVLETAETHVDEVPERFLEEELAEDAELKPSPDAAWHYFAACGTNFMLPRVGRATVSNLKLLRGPGTFPRNGCCGLLHYNYGDLETARTLARGVIERTERSAPGAAPVVADCSSCAAFLKSYPQLFLDDAAWLARADAFARRVRDAIELYPREALAAGADWTAGAATYHDSCRARNGEGVSRAPREAMRALAGDEYRDLPESEWCCGGAGAFAFVHPELSRDVLKRKVGNIAAVQAEVVATSSTSCLLQLAYGLKKYYPACRVVHLSELVAERLASPRP